MADITLEEYLNSLTIEKQTVVNKLRAIILNKIPEGFKEVMAYGMIGYVVPLHLYKEGYNGDPKKPLPFINIASQKNFYALYHFGIYSDTTLYNWFIESYNKLYKKKLDMGKSCIRFKKAEDIPYDLIGELVSKLTVTDWIKLYELQIKNRVSS